MQQTSDLIPPPTPALIGKRISTLKLGVVGLGGYAGYVCREALHASAHGDSIRFVAACDPKPELQPRCQEELVLGRVPILRDFEEFLRLDIDTVWLPLPIHLHRRFTEQALAAGKSVIVEKPAAGSVDDVDAMIATRDAAGLPVLVGFQNLFDANAWAVKRQLLAGRIGTVQRASVFGCWPRGESYYARTGWAGREARDGTWVLDSPLNNALSHFVNLAQFLLGPTVADSASLRRVEAELFRAYPIEMFDTCSIRATFANGVPLSIAMTHACQQNIEPIVTLYGSHGSVRFVHETNSYEFLDPRGQLVETLTNPTGLIPQTIQSLASFLAGNTEAPVATLEHSRAHTVLVNAVSEAADVVDVDPSVVRTVPTSYGDTARIIPGIEDALAACAVTGELLCESDTGFLRPRVGQLDVSDYRHFGGPRHTARPKDVSPLIASA